MNNHVFNTLQEVIRICEDQQIRYWVVGGFAVDAKRGFLSREHGDIDLCIHQDDREKCLQSFHHQGFKVTKEGLKFVFYKADVKIDIFELFVKKEYYERKREWFIAKYPKEMFDNFQVLTLNGLTFRIPSNEGLRYYGSKTKHTQDADYTSKLPIDSNIFAKIEYKEFADYKQSLKNVKTEVLKFDE